MAAQSGVVRFGPYEVRPSTRELFRHGIRVKLPPQAFEVLRLLLERRGELVTRQEFHQVLWPADTFVDFDQGLNNAIKRIREVLNDSAESPQYVETLPRLGYRFIGAAELAGADSGLTGGNGFVHPAGALPAAVVNPVATGATESTADAFPARARKLWWRWWLAAVFAALLLGSLAVAWRFRPYYPKSRISGERQLTADGISKWGPLATDGQRVYFTEVVDGRRTIAAVPISGGQAVPLKIPFAQAGMYAISPDRNDLLVAETPDMYEDAPLWRMPIIGGTPRRLGKTKGHDGSWSPDGTKLAYVIGSGVYAANADGSDARILVPPTGVSNEWAWRPAWSPDSRRLRFEYYEMQTNRSQLWEVNDDGTHLHPLFSPAAEWPMQAFGEWTTDGRYYLFTSWNEQESANPMPASNLWAIREKGDLWHRSSPSPVNLTSGPIRYFGHALSVDNKVIFALSIFKHGELMRYNPQKKKLSLYTPGLSAEGVTFSRDGAWVAYVKFPQGELWRSRTDGSEPLQLSSRPLFASSPVWSPDGSQIAFVGMRLGEEGHAYSVSADGGEPRRIAAIPEGGDPAWTPDGKSLLYLDKTNGDSNTVIRTRNLESGAVSSVAGSRGFWSPRISPDGRWIAALSNDLGKLSVFDSHTETWRELASGAGIVWPQWSRDSSYVYFAHMDAEPHIFRVKVGGGAPELVVTMRDFRITGILPGWFSLTPDGDVLLLHDTGGGTEIYALSWDAP